MRGCNTRPQCLFGLRDNGAAELSARRRRLVSYARPLPSASEMAGRGPHTGPDFGETPPCPDEDSEALDSAGSVAQST